MVASEDNPVLVWLNFIKNGVNSGDPVALGILVAVAVVFLTIGNEIYFHIIAVVSNLDKNVSAIW